MITGYGKESIIKKYNVGDTVVMNQSIETMNKLYNLRSSIRKLYTSVDTTPLTNSISRAISKSFSEYVDTCVVNISNYSITINCKPLVSNEVRSDIIRTVVRKIKNFIIDNSDIVKLLEEDSRVIKNTLDLSDSFVCDTYIIGDSISFLL